jgi:aspartyl protease family protein
MAESSKPGRNPWQQQNPRQKAGLRGRFLLWLLLLAATGLGVWSLSLLYPGRIARDTDLAYFINTMAFLAFVSVGVIIARRTGWRETARSIALWAAIAAGLVLVFAFKDELNTVWLRVRSGILPEEALTTGPHEAVLSRSADGHFYVVGDANGTRIRFLIDTGASDTVLSPADAKRIGIDTASLDFSRPYETANGVGLGAATTLSSLTIGPIVIDDMPVSVNQADMTASLLGMSFLRRLSSFEIRGDRLYLRE